MERWDRPRDIRQDRLATPPGVLIVSTRFRLRTAYGAALEEDGCVVLEAGTLDEARWLATAARSGEGSPIHVVLVDMTTAGADAFVDELETADAPPGLVLFGDGAAMSVDEMCSAVDESLASRGPLARRSRAPRVVVAIAAPDRRDEVVGALVRTGAAVVEVEDGLALLELVGRQLARGPRPDAIVADACLPRLDGVDALDEVRRLAPELQTLLLTSADPTRAAAEAVEVVTGERR